MLFFLDSPKLFFFYVLSTNLQAFLLLCSFPHVKVRTGCHGYKLRKQQYFVGALEFLSFKKAVLLLWVPQKNMFLTTKRNFWWFVKKNFISSLITLRYMYICFLWFCLFFFLVFNLLACLFFQLKKHLGRGWSADTNQSLELW